MQTWTERGRDLSWNGKTWRGNAPVLAVSGGSETMSPESHSLQIRVGAIDTTLRSLTIPFLAKVRIYRAFLDASLDLIPDPLLVYEERVDFHTIHYGEEPYRIINCENHAILMAQSTPRLRTHNDHSDEFPGDNFYKHTARLVENPLHVLVGYTPPMSL